MTRADATGSPRETRAHDAGWARSGATRRVALLGTGYIAEWHARALASIADVRLVAVCDQLQARAEAFARRFGVRATYRSLDAMLASERLDAVHVLLPPDLHFDAAQAVLDAGVHVLLEKPMCTRAAECESLARVAEARGLRVAVGHNFLFSDPYEQLRRDVRAGILGVLDHVTVSWHRELPQVTRGPFDAWMLRDPRNVILEIGTHVVAHLLDLVGRPDEVRAVASNAVKLPSGQEFYRRWQVSGSREGTGIDLRFSFVPGFGEFTIHARGSLASATVDLDRNVYALRRHHACGEDLDRYAIVREQARSMTRQARATLRDYVLSKVGLRTRGSPYGTSIARALHAFYAPGTAQVDERIHARTAAKVIQVCEEVARAADLSKESVPLAIPVRPAVAAAPRVLVLGATGFIGQELVRQLVRSGRGVRLMVRTPSKVPSDLRRADVECQIGDLGDEANLREAMTGIDCVYHLARADVKSWPDYERYEIGGTRRVAEAALASRVRRLVYTGTIDSYYAGGRTTITEETPLDPHVAHRNLYARAKAASEELLLRMRAESGLPVVILRPGIVIGAGASPYHWGVGMWWHDSVCQVWGAGRNPLPFVLVEDVARALVMALDAPGIEGESFNLVADPCLSAHEYLDEIDRSIGIRIRRSSTPIAQFYAVDMIKWLVKTAVRHPSRRLPSYRDWQSRTQRAVFDCTKAKARLNWNPLSDRRELVRRGIDEPLRQLFRHPDAAATLPSCSRAG